MACMQFSKPSKKTRKIGEEPAVAAELAATGESSKPRTTRSSQSKSSEASETGSIKHRKAATKPAITEQAPAELKAAAAAAGVGSETSSAPEPVITHAEIAVLAHSYWVARGYAPGSPEQDWLRAEQELKARR
jgi:Protein of unknown function (DUF2934)